jgi:hypothetical protein
VNEEAETGGREPLGVRVRVNAGGLAASSMPSAACSSATVLDFFCC